MKTGTTETDIKRTEERIQAELDGMANVAELEVTHKNHQRSQQKWRFYDDAYEGTEALVKNQNVLPKHPRETKENHEKRVADAYGFGYSTAVVDLLSFYLFQQPPMRDWGDLANDALFTKFVKDCDYENSDLEHFLVETQKKSLIQGSSGILVDKPKGAGDQQLSVAEAKAKNIYPYLAPYDALHILDWMYGKDENGKPVLVYLKLQDDLDNFDGCEYRIWDRTKWVIYKVINGKIDSIETGNHNLNEIPFTWVLNNKTKHRNIGRSDLREVAPIDASIIRNLSQAEEITEYAGFPMLQRPEEYSDEEKDDTVGPTSVIEFDPANPDSKASWLESEVKAPLDAILGFIYRKVEEIYRAINAGGLNTTEVTRQVKSGIALQQEFRLLNAKLATKSALLEDAERNVIYFWNLWEGTPEKAEQVDIIRPKDFNIADLLQELETVLMATTIVDSGAYDKQMQKLVVRKTLPSVESYAEIDSEIDAANVTQDEGETKPNVVSAV